MSLAIVAGVAHPLVVPHIDGSAESFLRAAGRVFAVFGRSQDSGNVSYGVEIAGERWFVKTAGHPTARGRPGALTHGERVELLRAAARFARRFEHPTLAGLHTVIESPEGPLLVYRWAPGELLHRPRHRRADPDSAFRRFRALPPGSIVAVLDQVIDLHVLVAGAGWVAGDFYDGCLIYDFAGSRLTIIDLDMYRPGPIRNERGRMFGSTRFMAPEEFELGAVVDERTTVFTLGRTVLVLLGGDSDDGRPFRGNPEQLRVARAATTPDPAGRLPSVAAFARAWCDTGR